MILRCVHENCGQLPQLPRLSDAERRHKIDMAKRLSIGVFASFTDLDFLLNIRRYHRASRALAALRKALDCTYIVACSVKRATMFEDLFAACVLFRNLIGPHKS